MYVPAKKEKFKTQLDKQFKHSRKLLLMPCWCCVVDENTASLIYGVKAATTSGLILYSNGKKCPVAKPNGFDFEYHP